MRPAWRLAISSVFQRPSRAILLIAVVAASAMLIAAVGVAISSINTAVEARVQGVVGSADVRIKPAGSGRTLPATLLERAREWEEVQEAAGRLTESLALRFRVPFWEADSEGVFRRNVRTNSASTLAIGLMPEASGTSAAVEIIEGRPPTAADEIVLDRALADRLSGLGKDARFTPPGLTLLPQRTAAEPMTAEAGPLTAADADDAATLNENARLRVGDPVEIVRFLKDPVRLRVVGISREPPLGGRPQCYMTYEGLGELTGAAGRFSEINLVLREGADPEALVAAKKETLPEGVIIQTTEKVTSGLDRNMRANRIGFVIASTMAFIAASFIIMTGMSTGVTERQRELAILRCIGADRWQLASSQIMVGGIIGVLGSVVGVPLGAVAAAVMVLRYKDTLGADLNIEAWRLGSAVLGAVGAGVLGAAYPAWLASRVTPLAALAARAQKPKGRTVGVLAAVGLFGIATHLALFTLPLDGRVVFWSYVTFGLPALMLGYFLVSVPALLVVVRAASGVISRMLGLPGAMLARTVRATPFRFGFTSGAMMAGLALMVAIWTQGGGFVRDWLEKIEFPDAFVVGLALSERDRETLETLPFVTATTAITMHPIETDAFGVRELTRFKTFFIAFEPRSFLEQTRLEWVQGDQETATRRLEEGGAVIVAREFLTARGMGVGETFRCWDNGVEHEFEIVGVVTSPGLEMVSKFFQVGEEFTDQSIHAVFGSRADLKAKFNSDAIGMIQISLADDVDDGYAMNTIREALFSSAILDAGSGREIKEQITGFVKTSLLVSSIVAVFSMLVASFGVTNLIVAGIQARRFEFGVLRAVGGSRGLLTRLIIGESLLIVVTACILGTLMGVQGAFGGTRLNELLWGLEIDARPPLGPILAGWGIVLIMTLGAATPAIMGLLRRRPRELLGAVRG